MVKEKVKEIQTPFGKVTLIEKEYPQHKHRREVIYWLGEMKCVELGELDKCYRVADRKSDFQPIKYVPFYYTVRWNENTDVSEVEDYYDPEVIKEREMEFDDEEEAREFISKLRCKNVKQGGVFTDPKRRYSRFKKAFKEAVKEMK